MILRLLPLLGAVCVFAQDLTTAPPEDTTTSGEEDFEGSQVLSVFVEKRFLVELIVKENLLDVWSTNRTHMDLFIPGKKIEGLKKKFYDNQIYFSVKIPDVATAIREQNPPPSDEDEELDGRKGHKMNWDKYQRMEVIYGYMDYLAQTYPNLVSVGSIGNSYEGNPIKYVKISSQSRSPKAFVIDGGIHAREWISPSTVSYILRELVENRNNIPAAMQQIDFYIIPILNPDGYEYTHSRNRLWRKNKSFNYGGCYGVDLNRNFGFHWGGKGTSVNSCSEIYKGKSSMSEKETRAFSRFIKSLPTVAAYVTFHSYGQYILIPYGYEYNSFPDDFKEMERVALRASQAMANSGGQHYTVGNTANTLYPAAGGSDDWVKSQTDATYVYTIELRDRGNYGFTLPARQILPTAKEAFEAIKVIASAAAITETWKETEIKLIEKARQNEQQKIAITNKSNSEIMQLKEKIKEADKTITVLQMELKNAKRGKEDAEKINEELNVDITRLHCEVDEYKREMEGWRRAEKEKIVAIETNATIQGKLSQANTEVTRKQTEIVRLNGMIGQLRGELEKIRLGSVINQSSENLTSTISQLQAALAIERENSKEVSKEKEVMSKEILDLRRQVKEMENILIKRSKSGSGLPLCEAYYPDNQKVNYEQKNKALQAEITQNQSTLAMKQQLLNDLQIKYDQDIFKLEQELKKFKKEALTLKNSLEERDRGNRPMSAAKEDAHLLATIRGLKAEISSRDKDIVRLNKELDDVRKTNRRLQREREKALNAGNKFRGMHLPKEDKHSRSDSDQSSTKEYNQASYEEEQETVLFLRSENRSLKEEIKKLEQDLISLHNKRIQDLSDLQEQHESEISRMVRDHAVKHSSSTVAHLQGQLYTQQMVIHHLKEQIKLLEGRTDEVTMLKAERDHLESTLIDANKRIARFHDLQSPESMQYSELLDKLDFLERRHEVREQKLQAIVRDLLTKQGKGLTCSSNCRDKLLNKNREICYYRAEMDKILDTLAEFRWNK